MNYVPKQPKAKRKRWFGFLVNTSSVWHYKRWLEVKAQITKFNDFTKGGAYVIIMKMLKYSWKSLSQCWTMLHFFYILDTILCKTLSLFEIKKGIPQSKVNFFKKGWEIIVLILVKQLQRDLWIACIRMYTVRCQLIW